MDRGKPSTSATDIIRDDHARVLRSFRAHRADLSPIAKRALVDDICLELKAHAEIEEEIFYPAIALLDPTLMDRSVPEHDEMRALILLLTSTDPSSADYDLRFMQLMRNVIHHVADEETMLLPAAESLLGDQLNELGARMKRRQSELIPHSTESLSKDGARGVSRILTLVAAGGFMTAYAVGHSLKRFITPSSRSHESRGRTPFSAG
jgi:hypothetical protein